MSNQREGEFVNDIFCIQSFWEVMVKFFQNPDLCQKVKSAQISPIQQPDHSLIAVTRKSLTIWSREMNQQEAERVIYRIGIRNFRGFGLA
jgi:hypothetical protein